MVLLRCLVSLLLADSARPQQIIFAQALWRHGARIPKGTYPSDPYQESYWNAPWGELTTDGMEMHFKQGLKLRKRYMEELRLLSSTYSRFDTTVRSADFPRCIQSALANLAALYSSCSYSPTYPNGTTGWPSGWTPIPVRTIPEHDDRELEAGIACPRADQLTQQRQDTQAFREFIASQAPLFQTINANSGKTYDQEFKTFFKIIGPLSVEVEDYNLTMPAWITPEFYSSLKGAVEAGEHYIAGTAGFGAPEDSELLKLRGGFMMKAFVDNVNRTVTNSSTLKFTAYSGHDTIVRQMLYILGVHEATIGTGIPYYSAMLVNELYYCNGAYFVKFLYSANDDAELVDVTSLIPSCNAEFCPLDAFLRHVEKYIPHDAEKECAAQ